MANDTRTIRAGQLFLSPRRRELARNMVSRNTFSRLDRELDTGSAGQTAERDRD